MKNVKIRTKLIATIAIIVALLTTTSIMAVSALSTTSESLSVIGTEDLPGIVTLWEVQTGLNDLKATMATTLLAPSNEETMQLLEEASVEATYVVEKIDEYKSSYKGDASDFELLDLSVSAAGVIRAEIVALAELNEEQTNLEAYDLLTTEYFPILETILTEVAVFSDRVDQETIDAVTATGTTTDITVIIVFVVVGISLIFSVVLSIILIKGILTPVKELVGISDRIHNGYLDVEVTYDSNDELGQVVKQFKQSCDTINAYVNDVTKVMGMFVEKDFRVPAATVPFRGDFKEIENSFRKFGKEISGVMGQIGNVSSQVASGSDQVSTGSQALAQGAIEQASSLQELAAAISSISDQVKHNAANCDKASGMAGGVVEAVNTSNEHMEELKTSMNEIDAKSKEISNIIKTIEDIAFQTNILALNAAVEAARAGAAGKGFAVVADEVRNLAGKSAQAAKNTTELIEGSIRAIKDGVNLTQVTAEDLVNVVEGVTSTTEVMLDIQKATNDQAISIEQVNVGLDQISQVVQTNSATSEESAAASEELFSQSDLLKNLLSEFKLEENNVSTGNQNQQMMNSPVQMPMVYDTGDKY